MDKKRTKGMIASQYILSVFADFILLEFAVPSKQLKTSCCMLQRMTHKNAKSCIDFALLNSYILDILPLKTLALCISLSFCNGAV